VVGRSENYGVDTEYVQHGPGCVQIEADDKIVPVERPEKGDFKVSISFFIDNLCFAAGGFQPALCHLDAAGIQHPNARRISALVMHILSQFILHAGQVL